MNITKNLSKVFIVCLLSLSFTNYTEAYTFGYTGLYNKVQFSNVDNDSLTMYINGGTEIFVQSVEDTGRGLEVFDYTPDVTAQRYNEICTQLELGIIPLEFKQMDTDYIIYGCITSLGRGNGAQGLIGIKGASDTVKLDVSVRIIERNTGKVVFTATGKGEAQAKGLGLVKVGKLKISPESLDEAVTKAMVQAADKIKKAI